MMYQFEINYGNAIWPCYTCGATKSGILVRLKDFTAQICEKCFINKLKSDEKVFKLLEKEFKINHNKEDVKLETIKMNHNKVSLDDIKLETIPLTPFSNSMGEIIEDFYVEAVKFKEQILIMSPIWYEFIAYYSSFKFISSDEDFDLFTNAQFRGIFCGRFWIYSSDLVDTFVLVNRERTEGYLFKVEANG